MVTKVATFALAGFLQATPKGALQRSRPLAFAATPTLAIMSRDGQRIPMTIPNGGIVRIAARNRHDRHLVDVEWEGKAMLMFAVDVRERGELVD